MSLADRMTCRQNANGTYTVRVTRRFVTQFGLGYRDETVTYVAETPPSSPGAAWRESQRGIPVAIAENPTNPPLTCGDVVLFRLGQRVLRRAAGSVSAVTWAEVCSPSWTYRPRLPRCRCRDLAWSSGAVRPSAARCWRAEWRSWWSVQPCLCGSWAAVACLNRYS